MRRLAMFARRVDAWRSDMHSLAPSSNDVLFGQSYHVRVRRKGFKVTRIRCGAKPLKPLLIPVRRPAQIPIGGRSDPATRRAFNSGSLKR